MLGTKLQKIGLLLLIIFIFTATSWSFFSEQEKSFNLNVKEEGNGIVNINPEKNQYLTDTKVALSAEAEENSTFVKWEGNHESEEETIEITIKGDTTITAVFKKKTEIVNFNDSSLEEAVRKALNKPSGPLYKSEVNDIQKLEAAGKGIQNLEGIENLTSLTYLDLGRKWKDGGWNYNIIIDLSPISNLVNINYLNLSGNKIENIAPLIKNNGIDSDNYVNLRYNNLEIDTETQAIKDIQELKERDVEIEYE